MLRRTTDILHFMAVGELVLFQQAVNMKLSKLECSLIHALFLHIEDIGIVRNIQKLMFHLLNREWSQFLKADDQSLVVLW